jgi:hypothetical protein
LGAIEYIIPHVIMKLGFCVTALEKTDNGLTPAFPAFFSKSDFGAKVGVHPEPRAGY